MRRITKSRKAFLATCAAGALVAMGIVSPASGIRSQVDTTLRFTSPSGNIDCAMSADSPTELYVDCLAQNAKWPNAKPQPADCDLDWDPHEITLAVKGRGNTAKPSLFVGGCRGDIGPLCVADAQDGCQVLNYGEKISLRNVTCESLKNGIQCVTNRGRKLGFLIGRNSWTRIA